MKFINDGSEFVKDVIGNELPTVVKFTADWCQPCKQLQPVLDEIASEQDGKINFVKIDIDKSRDLADEYEIKSVPTLMMFKNGKLVGQMVGAKPKFATLKTILDTLEQQ